ncbi:MAG: ABC transporter substrate-binding protein, partial [Geminicoccaceae bacterium]|nr:ABC transporter substrate-binding protein [Geminicoccaceae bacterium]
ALGIHATAHWNIDFDNEANREFVAAWQETYDRPITYYASQGYDTARLIASAFAQTGGVDDIDALREALRKADFASVRGDFAFGQNQHPVQDWYLLDIVEDGNGSVKAVTNAKLLEDYGDSYAAQCEM